MFFRSGFNYDTDTASEDSALVMPVDETVFTQQQFKEESDINTIVSRFGLTGEIPGDFKAPMSGDFTGITDFQTAMQQVRAAEEEFMRMPGELRARFANDPQQLLAFVMDDRNRDEAVRLGIVPPKVEVARDGSAVPAPKAPANL